MNYSVIIATLNRPRDLEKVLDSLLGQSFLPKEIIIVDQSDTLTIKEYIQNLVAQLPERCKVIDFIYQYQERKSLVIARNQGLRIAKGSVVSFLDDDVVLYDDYYENILNYFSKHPDVGGVSGNIINLEDFNGWKWFFRKSLMKIFLLNTFDGKMTRSGFGYPIFERKVDKTIEVEMLPGHNMNFKNKVIKNNKFDEWFMGYGYREDAEFSYRISKQAILMMCPKAKLYHNYSQHSRIDVRELRKMQFLNYYYMFKKHKYINWVSLILFGYSLFGLILIHFIEFLTSLNRVKLNSLVSDIIAVFCLLKSKER